MSSPVITAAAEETVADAASQMVPELSEAGKKLRRSCWEGEGAEPRPSQKLSTTAGPLLPKTEANFLPETDVR